MAKNITMTFFQLTSRKQLFWLISLLLTAFFSLNAMANTRNLIVSTDRQKVEMGDVVNLVVQTDFQTFDDLDLSPLKDQFKVLGTQRSTNVTIVNGNYQALTRWDVSITPKQAGELMIPPLTVDGVTSKPYKISVSPMQQTAGRSGVSFLESSVNTHKISVQQQVIYTLKYYHLGRFIDGSIRPPVFGDAINKQLKNQVNYQKAINGQLYDVFEWTWAFYPQKSGKLTIPAEQFDGRLQYRGVIKMIRNSSQPITIEVSPQAASYPKDKTWLPTPNLTLTQDWQMPNTLRVGDSITRTIKLSAKHLMSSQLPDISLAEQASFHVYPDEPKLSDQKTDGGINSAKTIKMAIVPLEAGKITLPPITVNWWNTQTHQLETAKLPEQTLTVLPALKPQGSLNPLMPQKSTLPVSHETSQTIIKTAWWWPALTVVFALLWLSTLALYLRHKRATLAISEKVENPALSSSSDLPATIEHICRLADEKDAKSLYQALTKWMQEHPKETQMLLNSTTTNTAWLNLKAHLFHQTNLAEQTLGELCMTLKSIHSNQSKKTGKQEGKQLDPIYPTQA